MTLNHSHSQLDHISNCKIDLMLISTVAQHSRGLPLKPASSWRTELWFPVLPPGQELQGLMSPVARPGSAVTPWRVRRAMGMFGWPCAIQLPHKNDWQWERGWTHILVWELWVREVTAEAERKKQVFSGSWESNVAQKRATSIYTQVKPETCWSFQGLYREWNSFWISMRAWH